MRALGLLITALALASSASAESEVQVRGELIWNSERQTLRPCGGEAVYWFRVLASNPHFSLSQQVAAISEQHPDTPVLVELDGTLSGVPSVGPKYEIDQTFIVSRIRSVAAGTCE